MPYSRNAPAYEASAYGHTEEEATQMWRSSATLEPGLESQRVWHPPLVPSGVAEIRIPIKPFALGAFASGGEMLQDLAWNGVLGFDDESERKLDVPAKVTPKFIILQPPSEIQ
jgi:hypothetical protein